MKKLLLILVIPLLMGAGCIKTNNDDKESLVKQTVIKQNNLNEIYNTMENSLELPHHFMKCIPETAVSCGENGCKDLEPTVFTLLSGSRSSGKLIRCDQKGCDSYNAIAQEGGIFENIQTVDPRGFFLKRQTMTAEAKVLLEQPYVEVTTTGITTNISRGYCSDADENNLNELGIVIDSYGASVLHVGGVGSSIVEKTAWLLSEHGYLTADDYIDVSFNGPRDLFWVYCKEGYSMTNCSDLNDTSNMLNDSCSMLIIDETKNLINFTCSK